MRLPEQQKRFYEDFGYLFLPGLMAEEVGWITAEFESVFQRHAPNHDMTKRTSISQMVERSERLCGLVDHPKVAGLIGGLIGEDFNYLGSGGELYVGGGMWHPDCHDSPVPQMKWATYLDPLTKETGALRVVPGSHRQGWQGNLDPEALWGISAYDVPCVAPENRPGDVMVFNLKTLHNSLGGGVRRRMLNMVVCGHCQPGTEREDLRRRLPVKREQLQWETMLATATPERKRHLQQPWEALA